MHRSTANAVHLAAAAHHQMVVGFFRALTPPTPTERAPMQRLKSRKFILALAGSITGVLVLFFPGQAGGIESAMQSVAGAVIAIGSIFGYIRAEGQVDAERAKRGDSPNQANGNPPALALAGVLVLIGATMLAGCTQAQEDRGTLSGQPTTVKLTIAGHAYEGTQTTPAIKTDENGFHRPEMPAVMTELDGQINAVEAALADARAAGDTEAVDRLTKKLAGLKLARTVAEAGGVTIVNVTDSGNVTITGSAETASPGDTTQTPTTEAEGTLEGVPGM